MEHLTSPTSGPPFYRVLHGEVIYSRPVTRRRALLRIKQNADRGQAALVELGHAGFVVREHVLIVEEGVARLVFARGGLSMCTML